MAEAIDLRRAGAVAAAVALLATDRGRILMDRFREHLAEMCAEEDRLLVRRIES